MTSAAVDRQDVLRAAEALNSFPSAIFDALNKHGHYPSLMSKAASELANSVQTTELETA